MFKFLVVATLVCYGSAGVISYDNGWNNGWNNNGWNDEWSGWQEAPKIYAAPHIVKTVAAPTIVKTVAFKAPPTSWANSNLWASDPVPVHIPVIHKVAAPVYTKVAAPIPIEKSWGGWNDEFGWNSKW